MTNMPHVIETALLLLVAFLIGCVIGYVLRCHVFAPGTAEEGETPEPAEKSAGTVRAPVQAKPSVAADGRPDTLAAPREGKKDNLKNIKGIGPKIETTLNELGIFHFDQVASWNRKTINWVDNYLSFKGRIDREEWVKQAKKLAKGS